MLKLYNKEHVAVSALTNLKDYKIEYLLSGEDSLEFSLSIADENIHLVEEEGYVRNKLNEYVIKAIDPSQGFKRYSCIVNVESIKGKSIANFDTSNNNITDTIRLAIAGTGWILADNNITKRRTVRLKNINALEVLREIRKVFRVDFRFDAINKVISVYEQFGSDKGVYFSDELNLRNLDIPSDTYDYATRLYAYGKDGLNIASINGGKNYIDNFQYSNKIIELIWEDNRYTDVNSLKSDAEAKLDELSKPKRSYQASISDLAKQSEEYSFLDFFLGDTVTLLSKSEKFRDKQRIVKYIQYPNNPSKNTCELGNTTLTFEELQKENEAKNQVVNNITSDNRTVDGSKVSEIPADNIKDLDVEVAKIVNLEAINIKVSNLEAQNVTITGKLTAIEGEFGTIKANVGTIDKLTVTHTAQINDLKANSATITQLDAVSAKIGTVEAEVGKIQTLVNGNLTSDNIHSLILTSSKVTVENGFIKNAMIENVDVSKINAGDISTNKFRIVSDSGKMLISDNTIQIKDNNKVRVQIGKDASNDYNMYVWDSSGKLMFDATGLKADGIKNKIIRDDMISDNANIDGVKLNISSVVTSINNGTTTIKGSKIYLDEKSQTLNVAFNTMSNTVNNHTSTIGSHTTSIGVMQGQITGLISDTTIVEDGTSKKIKDAYTSLKATVNGISSKVSSVESSFNNMQIGGRNLLLKSATNDLTAMSNHLGSTSTSTATIVADASSPSGKAIKIVKTNTTGTPGGGRYFKLKERLVTGETYSWSIYAKGTGSVGSMGPEQGGFIYNVTLTSEYKKITHTFVATENQYYQFVFYGGSNFDLTFHSIKLEKGTKVTDWSPAPEDVDSLINAVDTKVSALDVTVKSTSSKVSAIEQSMESITQRVSSTETKVITVTNTANTAKTQADKAVADAKTASDKATNAQSTANSANSKIDGLQVGSTNIIKGTNTITQIGSSGTWSAGTWRSASGGTGTREIVTVSSSPNPNIKKGIKLTATSSTTGNTDIAQDSVPVTNGITYTLSCYARKISGDAKIRLQYGKSPYPAISTKITATTWTKFSFTFTVGKVSDGSTGGSTNIYFGIENGLVGSVELCGFKLEVGNKATDWTPAPEDVQTQIDANKTEISTTKNKVSTIETNLSSITSKVSTVEQTQITVNGKVTALETWKKSAEQKITDSAIISTVSSQFYNKGQTDSKYATQSSVATLTQTVNGFNFLVEKSGRGNLIYNSRMDYTTSCWNVLKWGNGAVNMLPGRKSIQFTVDKVTGTNGGVISDCIPVTSGGNYSLAFLYNFVRATDSICWINFLNYETNDPVFDPVVSRIKIDLKSNVADSQVKQDIKVPSNATFMRIFFTTRYNNSSTTYQYAHAYIYDLRLFEGSGAIPPWCPHSYEILNSAVTIDNQGLLIQQTGEGSTRINREEFYQLDRNGTKLVGIKDGGLHFYKTDGKGHYLGSFKSSKITTDGEIHGTTLYATDYATYMDFGVAKGVTEDWQSIAGVTPFIRMARYDIREGGYKYGINFCSASYIKAQMEFEVSPIGNYLVKNERTDTPHKIYGQTVSAHGMRGLALLGEHSLVLKTIGASGKERTVLTLENGIYGEINMWGHMDCHGNEIYNVRVSSSYSLESEEANILKDCNFVELDNDKNILKVNYSDAAIHMVKETKTLNQSQVIQDENISFTEDALNCILMGGMSTYKRNGGTNSMASYLGNQIYKGKLEYDEVISRYPDFKKDIDLFLENKIKNDGLKFK